MNNNIIFEVIPPSKMASEAHTNKLIDKVADTVNEIKNISMLNVPEIVDENHIGIPYYRNIDVRKFGKILMERCKKDIMVNTVVAYHSKNQFGQWLDESINDYGIKNFVFVGQKINSIKYPGPSIIDANSIARNKKISFGNIFIPERENEADRLISKTSAGCNFFTSQVLFEPYDVLNVIKEYYTKCSKADLMPAKFFLSFSPVSNLEDIAFIKWLGAEIKEKTEKRLKSAQNFGEESIRVIIGVLDEIIDFFDKMDIKIPLGLNIEYVALHNLELSKNLVNTLFDSERYKYILN